MEYQTFLQAIQDLNFVQDRDTADAAIKSVLGHLASRMDEPEARKLTEDLPDPLTLEKLRSHQANITLISAEEYYNDLCDQFKISEPQARELTNKVLQVTRDAIGEDKMKEFKDHLPYDWSAVVIPA